MTFAIVMVCAALLPFLLGRFVLWPWLNRRWEKVHGDDDNDKEKIDMRIVIKKSDDDQYYFILQASGNHETLATSETYREKRDANAAVLLIVNGAADAVVVDET